MVNEEMRKLMEEYLARHTKCVNVSRHPEFANLSDKEIIDKFEALKKH